MFDYDKTLEKLEDFKKINPGKRKKIILKLFNDDTFIEWLFQPQKVPNLNEMVSALYAEFTKPVVMQAIIDARQTSGLTQKELSERTGIAQGDISKLENGNANPSIKTLQRLASAMGMSLKIEFVPN